MNQEIPYCDEHKSGRLNIEECPVCVREERDRLRKDIKALGELANICVYGEIGKMCGCQACEGKEKK